MTTTTATVASVLAHPPTAPVIITDDLLAVQNNLDALQALIADDGTNISGIALVAASPIPAISLSADQFAKDSGVIGRIAGPYTVAIDGSLANLTVTNSSDHGASVTFSGTAAQYSIQASSADGQSFIVTDIGTGRSSVDHFTGVQELHFADATYIVASEQFLGSSLASGVQITSLYAAVLGRTPDLAGLAYYEALAAQNIPMGFISEYFLSSPEYLNNPAHNYAQTTAGEAQYITDTYHNVLHRDPGVNDIPFYQNVIGRFTEGLTPGTGAYANAELQGHAVVLIYFALSQEYRETVQITAQHPADAGHFLYVL